jgi:hypothetical protein
MAVDYPEDLLPDNVIVSLSEGTETEPEYRDSLLRMTPLTDPHRGSTGLGDDDTTQWFPGLDYRNLILAEQRKTNALLTEIRDIAASVKIPAFLKGKK